MSKILLYINTIKYLKLIQILYQIWNRLPGKERRKIKNGDRKRNTKRIMPISILIPILDFDEEYLSRFCIEDLLENQIELLHEKHSVNLKKWKMTDASHLWNYNLHYMEYLIPLAVACRSDKTNQCFEKWREYVNAWIEHPAEDSFEPYTISIRIPNLLICMNILQEKVRGSELERKLADSIYQQYQYLLATQELGLLANHYFENLKTILICSVLFGENDIYQKYFARFLQQIEEQILSDGIHFERSLMYHKIILEDILRVYMVLEKRADAKRLIPVMECMSEALASICRGFRHTPLFNDAGDNVAKNTSSLLRAVQGVTGRIASDYQTSFPISGYYKLYGGKNTLLFDCGQMGPSYMCGHAHCDCLSFELARNGKMLFVNSGTYQYQGKLRQFFRSTMAHNTVMIDKREQAELWGEHRAARRMTGIRGTVGDCFVSGEFRSFCGDHFDRMIELTESYMRITDCIHAKDGKSHWARQFFHLACDCHYEQDDKTRILVRNDREELAMICIPNGSEGRIYKEGDICSMAKDFGERRKKEVLEIRTPFEAEVKIQIWISL